jgi:ferredoxin-NADP reductase
MTEPTLDRRTLLALATGAAVTPKLAMAAAAKDQADPLAAQVEAITAPLVGAGGLRRPAHRQR